LRHPQRAQHLEPGHVGEVQVEQDDVVVVQLAEIDALFAEVRRIDVEALGLEHQFDRLRCRAIVFDQENAHARSLPLRARVGPPSRQPWNTPWEQILTLIRTLTNRWLTK